MNSPGLLLLIFTKGSFSRFEKDLKPVAIRTTGFFKFPQNPPSLAEAQSISKSGQGERRKGQNRRRKWGTEGKKKKMWEHII